MESFWDHLHNITDANSIISQGGFYLLLVVVFAETGLFFGFFLPGDYLLFMAGLFCATGSLDVSVYTLISSLIISGILGNFMGYWFGYRTGPLLFNKNDSLFFKRQYIVMAEKFYDKYGGMALILGRFFPIIRTFAPIFAGVVKVKLNKFTLYNIIGSIAWVLTLTLTGYFLGKKYPQLKDYLQYIVIGLILVTSLPLVFAFLRKRLTKNETQT
ncbi:VTT domain-containing protein [Mucilaginibacter sp. RS28]|uniref:VTT domain-containing protein n=1 Tax=Mucilaginibacter straminoryzae TaxID=2932774 RepID=A0A9X1X489_9SPHI|nr:VTT domain-containing protein [Mucilaginibacter straminoryzae]MCJ8210759.1 VTT domain-containing protein [Mucilaginibacter straminoryzae]